MARSLEGVGKVTLLKRLNTLHKRGERTRDGVRDGENEGASSKDGHQADSQKQMVQPLKVCLDLAV